MSVITHGLHDWVLTQSVSQSWLLTQLCSWFPWSYQLARSIFMISVVNNLGLPIFMSMGPVLESNSKVVQSVDEVNESVGLLKLFEGFRQHIDQEACWWPQVQTFERLLFKLNPFERVPSLSSPSSSFWVLTLKVQRSRPLDWPVLEYWWPTRTFWRIPFNSRSRGTLKASSPNFWRTPSPTQSFWTSPSSIQSLRPTPFKVLSSATKPLGTSTLREESIKRLSNPSSPSTKRPLLAAIGQSPSRGPWTEGLWPRPCLSMQFTYLTSITQPLIHVLLTYTYHFIKTLSKAQDQVRVPSITLNSIAMPSLMPSSLL